MYIVYIGKGKHSVWNTRKEAYHQADVLIQNGYSEGKIWIDYVEGANYENGHYFV
jgi:hypothetical protein